MTGPALAFGLVHRHIGLSEQALGYVLPAAGKRHADTGSDHELDTVERKRLGERLVNTLAQDLDVGGAIEVLAQEHKLVAGHARQGVAGPDEPREALRDRDQQLVANLMPVVVVHLLEPVEVREQDRRVPVRPPPPLCGVLQSLEQQRAVGESRERVMERVVLILVRGLAGIVARLRVQQVGGGDVGEGLRDVHVVGFEPTGAVAVKVECAETPVAMAQREREHCGQTRRGRGGRELRKAVVVAQVGHRDGLAGSERRDARPLRVLSLEALIAKRRCVRSGHVARSHPFGNQGDANRSDGQDVDDASDEVIEDSLDREVGDQRPGEVAENLRQLFFLDHLSPVQVWTSRARAWSGRVTSTT